MNAYLHNSTRMRRRGVQVVEAIVVIPILVIVTFGVVQYGATIVIGEAVLAAAQEGAREAAKDDDAAEVADIVEQILAVHGLTVAGGSGVRVIIEDENGVIGDEGDATVPNTKVRPSVVAGEIRVIVLVRVSVAPVPNVLTQYGIDFSNRIYNVSALARRQT